MKISIIIAISLAANIILAGWLLHANRDSALGANETESYPSSATTAIAASTESAEAKAPNDLQISWRDLQAKDLKEFIRRLRAVNCPEATIEDLILAEVNRRYGARQRTLWPDDSRRNDYWKPYKRLFDAAENKKNRERSRQMRDLQKEKSGLLVELFGVDVEKQRRNEEGIDNDDWGWNPMRNLSFLPEAKRDVVQKYLDDFQDKEQEFYASVQGGWDADARAKQKQLEQEKLAGLAQFLTPDEVREYKLRNSQTATQITSDLHGVDLSRQQYEAMFDIREKYGDSIYNWADAGNNADTIKQIEQNKKDMQAEIAGALGTEKAQELERAQDYNYQQLASLAKRNDLPSDTATKIYDFKGESEKAAQALRTNPDLTPEQRQAALAEIRTETEQAVKTALGDKLYKRYLNDGGWWLNNIAPRPRP